MASRDVGLDWWEAVRTAAAETIALFRPSSGGVTFVGVGVWVEYAARILGPVLLALAVLAIGNRTKR